MKNAFLHAYLASKNSIRIVCSKEIELDKTDVRLLIDGEKIKKLSVEIDEKTSEYFIDFEEDVLLGHSYFIDIPEYGRFPLDVRSATSFAGFDEEFYYEGQLGAIYSKEKTIFRLWAPLASKVVLKLKKPGFAYDYLKMKRIEKGVFELEVKGNLDGSEYLYEVTNNEVAAESIDPYAKGSTENGRSSVVLDFESLRIKKEIESLPELKNYIDSVIYEGNVRDLTIGRHTNIDNKGKYLGLIEENRTTEEGHPAGLDYYKMLGFTHIQLLPINDFKTVDELKPNKSFNWGYDPAQYFVPEGSYSTNPKDPKSRIVEVQKMVQGFHKAGIRVVLDVVFNHVYEYLDSSFEKITPNYWFRKKKDGKTANTSWCGNDVATEKPMVRKMILDAARWWIDYYDIDGFRCDLMGILDVETVNAMTKIGKSKDPSFMVYGEGWNMGGEADVPLANMDNHRLLPGVAFFNDCYRESAKRYISGDGYAKEDFKYSFLGSSSEWCGKGPKFDNVNQTINYVECHDNWTYHDYLENVRGQQSQVERLNRCKLALASVLLSFGIPFVHAGEETGQSKFGVENSYKSGDSINKFSWALLDQRWDMAIFFKDLIKLRKSIAPLNSSSNLASLKKCEFSSDGDCIFVYLSYEKDGKNDYKMTIILNPSNNNMNYTFDGDQTLIFTSGGLASSTNTRVTNVLIPKQSFVIVDNK